MRRRQFQQYFHVDCAVESKLTTTDELTRAYARAHFVPVTYEAPPPDPPEPTAPADEYQQHFEVSDEPEEAPPPEPTAPVEESPEYVEELQLSNSQRTHILKRFDDLPYG